MTPSWPSARFKGRYGFAPLMFLSTLPFCLGHHATFLHEVSWTNMFTSVVIFFAPDQVALSKERELTLARTTSQEVSLTLNVLPVPQCTSPLIDAPRSVFCCPKGYLKRSFSADPSSPPDCVEHGVLTIIEGRRRPIGVHAGWLGFRRAARGARGRRHHSSREGIRFTAAGGSKAGGGVPRAQVTGGVKKKQKLFFFPWRKLVRSPSDACT